VTRSADVSPFAIVRNRRFRLMWSAQIVSSVGDSLIDVAAALVVYRATGSALAVGLVFVATAAPALIVGLVAGVFVDRFDRKRIMIACEVLRGAAVLAIPFLVTLGIGWIYVAVAAVSAIGTFFGPAHASVVPEIARDDELAAATSLLSMSGVASTAVGFAAGGLIASATALHWAFYVDSLVFGLSALIVSRVAVPPSAPTAAGGTRSILRNLASGLTFLWGRQRLRSLLLVGAGVSVAVGLQTSLLLPFTVEALAASELVFGLQSALMAIGFVAGALVMVSRADRLHEGQWLTIALVAAGVVGSVYAAVTSIPTALALIMLAGFLNAPYGVAKRLIIQRQTPRGSRGRVGGTFAVVSNVCFLLGMTLVGLADVVGPRPVYLATALATVALGVIAGLVPGLGQPAAEWRRAAGLLRGASSGPRPYHLRAATPADYAALARLQPALAGFTPSERATFAADTSISEAPSGSAIVRAGERSDAAYFVLEGRAVAGPAPDGSGGPLESLGPGDVFGEIAALTGVPRTTSVVAEVDSRLLVVPSAVLARMAEHPELGRLVKATMATRLARLRATEAPIQARLDDAAWRDLRRGEAPDRHPG
jgi:CRP-like cAMP-binding protein/Na+/melibiose symporter-like transporter